MSYLDELEGYLHALPRNERDDMMSYYEEYFTDAHIDDTLANQKFGSSKQFSRRLIADFYMNEDDAVENKPKHQLRMIWVVLLGILASPIALSATIVVAFLLLVVIGVVLSVIVSVMISLVISAILAVFSIIAGIIILFSSLTGGIFAIGVGSAMIGLIILVVPLLINLTKILISSFAKIIKLIGRRYIQKGANYEA